MPKDILEVCREWQSYWGHRSEGRLKAFAKQAGDEIERLRHAAAAEREACAKIAETWFHAHHAIMSPVEAGEYIAETIRERRKTA